MSNIESVENLVFEAYFPGERLIIPNLTGLRCLKCGKIIFDRRSNRIIDEYVRERVLVGYEVKISHVGGRHIGIYFPKNILRVMNINKGDKAVLIPIHKNKMILELL